MCDSVYLSNRVIIIIIIVIIIIKSCLQHRFLTIRFYRSLFLVSSLDSTQCLHKADEYV